MSKVIEIKNLKKSFNDRIVVNDLSLEVKKGEKIAIIGENGAGKSVLMKTMAGLLKPDSGEVIVSESIDIQLQDINTNLNLKVIDLIKVILSLSGRKIDEDIEDIMDIFKINHLKEQTIDKISGGQKQRLNLFLSTINDSDILLLDEFITGLDYSSISDILEYLLKQVEEKKKTLIIVSHQPEEIRTLSERIILMKEGKIINEWKTKTIEKKYNGKFTEFLKDVIV